jgi:ketosteroid isomerase-like protein
VTDLAKRFAESLDNEDYDTARACLRPDAVYQIGGDEHRGPEAIVASYRGNGDWAARTLDHIEYESSAQATGDFSAKITFVDRIEHAGEKLVHRCEQHLEFDDGGRIRAIRHVDLPGEPEALEAFFQRVGLARGGSEAEED